LFSQTVGAEPPQVIGQFVDEKREGEWVSRSDDFWEMANWHRGKLDGLAKSRWPSGRRTTYQFANGRLTHIHHQPLANRLFTLLERGASDETLAMRLGIPAVTYWNKMPLAHAVSSFSSTNNLPVVLDTQLIPDVQMAVSAFVLDIDGASALTLLTEPHG